MEVTFDIYMESVYREVAQTTSYTGAKMEEDATAYERIFTTDEDQGQLERFWDESCVTVCEVMKRYLTEDMEIGGIALPGVTERAGATLPEKPLTGRSGHRFRMEFSRSFDAALVPSMRQELFSYFVMSITAKWYVFTNKKEAPEYAAGAAVLLEGIHRKACYKRKPQRPTYQ